MPRPPRDSATQLSPAAISDGLSAPERVLLFCVSSGTEWVRVGITSAVVQHSRRGGRKRALATRALIAVPRAPNGRWSVDFVADQFIDGGA